MLFAGCPHSAHAGAGISLNGVDAICKWFIAFADEYDYHKVTPEFARTFVKQHGRSVMPAAKLNSFLADLESEKDGVVMAFVGMDILNLPRVVSQEYLEADHANHVAAKNKIQNSILAMGAALVLLVMAALKMKQVDLGPFLSNQAVQGVGGGILAILAAWGISNRWFGPSYGQFIDKVFRAANETNGPGPYYWGQQVNGVDRRASYVLDILFARSDVPEGTQPDIGMDLSDTPVVLVFARKIN